MPTRQSADNSLARLRIASSIPKDELHRRVVYLMIFRLVLITLILVSTIALSLLGNRETFSTSNALIFGILAMTYLLTVVYAIALPAMRDATRLGLAQVVADLLITAALVHLTGGAQSAYTFLFPLSIISASVLGFRGGVVSFGIFAAGLFVLIASLGYFQILPAPDDQWVVPYGFGPLTFVRQIVLNLLAFAGVGILAFSLAGEIQTTKASLAVERAATANLVAVHEDIVRSLSSGLITVDTQGTTTTINATAAYILGIGRRPGAHYSALLPGLKEKLEHLDQEEALRRSDLTLPDGKSLGISVSPLRDKDDNVIGQVINFQDLTELKEMEDRVRQAERLATLGRLAAGVAHEIRNPLASISGSVELLSSSPETNDENRALMGIVTREIERLDGLIRELLEYTNPGPKTTIVFDLNKLIQETVTVLRHGDTSDISIAVLTSSEPVWVSGDPSKIRQVVWNLLKNACEALEDAGNPELEILTRIEDNQCIAEFTDNGPGIAPDAQSKIFEPFFSTKSRGTGLGLATCHAIMSEHEGSIWVESEVGKGTTFTFLLPKRDEPTT